MKKIILSITLIFCFVLSSSSQTARTPTVNPGTNVAGATQAVAVGAQIIQPLTLSSVAMSFGKISARLATDAGTVAISAAATAVVTPSDNINIVNSAVSAGQVIVTGEATEKFSLFMPTSVDIGLGGDTSGSDSTKEMTINLTNTALENGLLNLLNGGSSTIYIGGTLNINANQEKGSYSGSFNVFCLYE